MLMWIYQKRYKQTMLPFPIILKNPNFEPFFQGGVAQKISK